MAPVVWIKVITISYAMLSRTCGVVMAKWCEPSQMKGHDHIEKGTLPKYMLLPPATKLPQGNVFTPVCHSVHGEGSLSQHAPQVTWPGRVSVQWGLSRGVFVQGGLCPGQSLSRVFIQGGLCPGGLSVQGGSMFGDRNGGLCPGGFCPAESLSSRVSVQQGVFVRETPWTETSPYGTERAIRFLLECILVPWGINFYICRYGRTIVPSVFLTGWKALN